jgi:hypothetical protein
MIDGPTIDNRIRQTIMIRQRRPMGHTCLYIMHSRRTGWIDAPIKPQLPSKIMNLKTIGLIGSRQHFRLGWRRTGKEDEQGNLALSRT